MLARFPLCLLVSALALAGCASSGDLHALPISLDTSLLEKVDSQYVDAAYKQPDLDLSKYKTIWIEWPRLDYTREPQVMTQVSREEVEALRQYFRDEMIKALRDGYTLVNSADPDSLHIRTTITALASTENPFRTTGVGYAAIEASYRDVTTGMLLAAMADKRSGGEVAAVSKWSDAQGAFRYWARLFRRHLDEMRGQGKGIF